MLIMLRFIVKLPPNCAGIFLVVTSVYSTVKSMKDGNVHLTFQRSSCGTFRERHHRKNEIWYSFLGQKSDLQLIEIEREIVCAKKKRKQKKKSSLSMKRSRKNSRETKLEDREMLVIAVGNDD